jgi:hypothetical protein
MSVQPPPPSLDDNLQTLIWGVIGTADFNCRWVTHYLPHSATGFPLTAALLSLARSTRPIRAPHVTYCVTFYMVFVVNFPFGMPCDIRFPDEHKKLFTRFLKIRATHLLPYKKQRKIELFLKKRKIELGR